MSNSHGDENFAPMPIIVGAARSGTTLLRLMLDAHPELCIPPETGFIPEAAALIGEDIYVRESFLKLVVQSQSWPDFNLSLDNFWNELAYICPFDVSEGLRCFYRLYSARFNKKRWGDKTPVYCLGMLEIQRVLPEAHFIHIIRDARDAALSVLGLWFAPGTDLETIALDWSRRIQKTRALGKICHHYMEIKYEDLIRNYRVELLKICEFLGLPYDLQMERYFETSKMRLDEVKTVYKPDGSVLITKEERLYNHRFTSQPPQVSRIFRWKKEMSQEMRVKFESVAGDMLRELGYETLEGAHSEHRS